jgi:hypothetical protein
MAATYKALGARKARQASARSSRREKWRNRVTGGVILAALFLIVVYTGGGNLGRLPVATLRKVGRTPEGHPVYS